MDAALAGQLQPTAEELQLRARAAERLRWLEQPGPSLVQVHCEALEAAQDLVARLGGGPAASNPAALERALAAWHKLAMLHVRAAELVCGPCSAAAPAAEPKGATGDGSSNPSPAAGAEETGAAAAASVRRLPSPCTLSSCWQQQRRDWRRTRRAAGSCRPPTVRADPSGNEVGAGTGGACAVSMLGGGRGQG